MTVFVLQHEDDDGDIKFVGVYSTREKAEEARARVKLWPGFNSGHLSIDEYQVDQDNWVGGF